MEVLTADDVRSRLSWAEGLKELEAAFKTRKRFQLPERIALSAPGGTLLTMPCADDKGWFGVKQVSVMPGNPGRGKPSVQAWYTLFDPTGTPVLACDATLLTRFRTAAVSAVAAKYLAPAQTETLLVVGTGSLSPWLGEAHLQVRPYQTVLVWGRSAGKAEATAADLELRFHTAGFAPHVSVAADLAAAVSQADVITVATTARTPFLKGEWLRNGQHLDLVGAFTPEMAEADADAVKRADVFVDDLEACMLEAGDLIQAQAQGWSFGGVYGDLPSLVAGEADRSGPGRITLFKSVGLALEDLVVAKLLLKVPHLEAKPGSGVEE